MRITIEIPDDFVADYESDKFNDFFNRVAAECDGNGVCGLYEREIAEMFASAFAESVVGD